jgi:hypothetical protein
MQALLLDEAAEETAEASQAQKQSKKAKKKKQQQKQKHSGRGKATTVAAAAAAAQAEVDVRAVAKQQQEEARVQQVRALRVTAHCNGPLCKGKAAHWNCFVGRFGTSCCGSAQRMQRWSVSSRRRWRNNSKAPPP